MNPEELQEIIQGIDVETATCFDDEKKSTRKMILDSVIKQSGHLPPAEAFTSFNTNLKLQLMLKSISHKTDLDQLLSRSKNTQWKLGPVSEWINSPSMSRALVIMGGAGVGKSSISAAICNLLLGMNQDQPSSSSSSPAPIAAAHFIKFSDARRLDTVRALKWICFQLAKQIPEFAAALLKLSAADVQKLTDFVAAFEMLLSLLPKLMSQPVFLLFDAIDEADPIEYQFAGSKVNIIKPSGNRMMYMLTSCLVLLPANFRFIITTRPDAMMNGVKGTLERSFKSSGGVSFIEDPSSLRASDGAVSSSKESKVMIFDYIYDRCGLDKLGFPRPPSPSLTDTYAAYQAIFDLHKPSKDELRLLSVLVAAQEPLSVQMHLLDGSSSTSRRRSRETRG